MGLKPKYDMFEIPQGNHPAWGNISNRVVFEEDMRIHLYDAIDQLNVAQMTEEERRYWEQIVSSLGNLARFYKGHGFDIHTH